MINAKQARQKQASINWRDNSLLVAQCEILKEKILMDIEMEINEALLIGEKQTIFFLPDEYERNLKVKGVHRALVEQAFYDTAKNIHLQLQELGYNTLFQPINGTIVIEW